MEDEKQLCFANKKLEVAYYEHGFDVIVEKDMEDRWGTATSHAHHRGNIIEAVLWIVYNQVSRKDGHRGGMQALRRKLNQFSIFPRPGTVLFTTIINPQVIKSCKKTGEWPMGPSNDFRCRYGGSANDIGKDCVVGVDRVDGFVVGARRDEPAVVTAARNTSRPMLAPKSRNPVTQVQKTYNHPTTDMTEINSGTQPARMTSYSSITKTTAEAQKVSEVSQSSSLAAWTEAEVMLAPADASAGEKSRDKPQRLHARQRVRLRTAPTAATVQPLVESKGQVEQSGYEQLRPRPWRMTEPNGADHQKQSRKQEQNEVFGFKKTQPVSDSAPGPGPEAFDTNPKEPKGVADGISVLESEHSQVQNSSSSPPPSSPLDHKTLTKERYHTKSAIEVIDLTNDSPSTELHRPSVLPEFTQKDISEDLPGELSTISCTSPTDNDLGVQPQSPASCDPFKEVPPSGNRDSIPPLGDGRTRGIGTSLPFSNESMASAERPKTVHVIDLTSDEEDLGAKVDKQAEGSSKASVVTIEVVTSPAAPETPTFARKTSDKGLPRPGRDAESEEVASPATPEHVAITEELNRKDNALYGYGEQTGDIKTVSSSTVGDSEANTSEASRIDDQASNKENVPPPRSPRAEECETDDKTPDLERAKAAD